MNDSAALLRRIDELEAKLDAASRRLTTLEDIEAIKKLQRIYGYYVDKAQWTRLVGLFSEDCAVEISGRGRYLGHKGAEVVFRKIIGQDFPEGLDAGQLHNHFQLQGVVTVADDGRTAKARWRAFIQVSLFGKLAHWAEGPYEMEYAKRDGVWQIKTLLWFPTYYTPYEAGWAKEGLPRPTVSEEYPPDLPPSYDYETFPGKPFIPPFHFRHPVTGKD